MRKPGYRGGAPAILVIGGVIIALSLVVAGVNHHSVWAKSATSLRSLAVRITDVLLPRLCCNASGQYVGSPRLFRLPAFR